MPPRTRKAAEAAQAEATADETPIKVKFRGHTFNVDPNINSDVHFTFALASGSPHQLLFAAIGPKQSGEFLALVKRGENVFDVANEFLPLLSDAAGWGNS